MRCAEFVHYRLYTMA